MSYRYISAVASTTATNGRFIAVQIGDLPLRAIFQNYLKIYVTLEEPITRKTGVLDLHDIPPELQAVENTLNQWLVINGNKTLPLQDITPPTGTAKVKYWDAWRLRFKGKAVSGHYHPDNIVSPEMREHLLLTKEKVDYQQLFDHCLFTVNGFIHRSAYSVNGVYVLNATKSATLANDTQVGIIDFTDIGKIKIVPITDDMIVYPTEELKLSDGAYIKIPGDLTNKTVALVLGGYLHIADKSFRFINDSVIKIDCANLPFVERFYESRKFIDLTEIGIEQREDLKDTIQTEEVYSDEATKNYLQLSQSFIVIIDAPEIYVDYIPLQTVKVPGHYITPTEPNGLVVGYLNQCYDYTKRFSDGEWILTVANNLADRPARYETNWRDYGIITNHRVTWNPVNYANAFIRDIFKPS